MPEKIKIAVGSDHAAFPLKEKVREHLVTKGYEVEDHGTESTMSRVDRHCIAAESVEPGYASHIVNHANLNMMHEFVRRLYPVRQQVVDFDVAEDKQISRVRALCSGRGLTFRQSDRRVLFELPQVADYEVIALT